MSFVSNIKKGKLCIKKRSTTQWLSIVVLLLPFAFSLLIDVFRIPDFIRFGLDAILVYFCVVLISKKSVVVEQKIKPLIILVLTFFLYTFINYMFNFQSPFYYFWGLRNIFRFYIAFFAFVTYISEDEAINLLEIIDVIFWINFVISVFQFLLLGVSQDYLGGVFGIGGGTNGYTLVFFCIVIAKSLLQTFSGKEKVLNCILKCAASLLVAAMAEMKFYYFAFILILILASFSTRFSFKKLALVFLCILGIVVGSFVLTYLFESDNFLTIESLWESATNESYSSGEDLNRLAAIDGIRKEIFSGSVQDFFGLGLGNCDISDISIFSTPFSQRYAYLHYSWFTSPMIFLETGYVGLAMYLSFFILLIHLSHKRFKNNIGNTLFCQMGMIMAIISIIISFYNSTLRIESAYMIYFVLALPFIDSQKA